MRTLLTLIVALSLVGPTLADEGMWLYNDPPRKLLQDRFGFEATDEWLEHLQKSSVRFNNGGSGSFVSSEGLVMTNHHVAADSIQKLSDKDHDYIKTGFLARDRSQELKTPDLELNVLVSIEDVSDKVKGAVKAGVSGGEAEQARRAMMNQLEKESLEKTGLRSDVVTLFRGGQYHLYRYRRYTDVRLVFAPEIGIAFYGGDADNFEYPRYCLDVAFFRVYEDGKPINPEQYLRWSDAGIKEGELIFVSGHPGRTERLNTVAHLEFLRDVRYPLVLQVIRRVEVLLKTYGDRGREYKRQAQDDLFGYQNARKAYLGGLAGLQNPEMIRIKRAQEAKLKAAVAQNPQLKQKYGDPWQTVDEAMKDARQLYRDHYLLESGRAFNSSVFSLARHLVRYADESQKPNAERLRTYRESNLESLKQQMLSSAPIYKRLEAKKLADSLSMWLEWKGPADPLVQKVLDGMSPEQRANAIFETTRVDDPAYRKQLVEGGPTAIAAAQDPMLELARAVDPQARELEERYEARVESPLKEAYGKIAQIIYEVGGSDLYPDATFSLRLAFGVVKGYTEAGVVRPYTTTISGLYSRAAGEENTPPYNVPEPWQQAVDELDVTTPFNFVSTPDITGGNSGSPVVNRAGEVVGLIFDGNIQSLVIDFLFEDEVARAISVDARAIKEALNKVYNAGFLASELGR